MANFAESAVLAREHSEVLNVTCMHSIEKLLPNGIEGNAKVVNLGLDHAFTLHHDQICLGLQVHHDRGLWLQLRFSFYVPKANLILHCFRHLIGLLQR